MADLDLSQGKIIDLLMPRVRFMVDNPGFYIIGDVNAPEGFNLPLISRDGRLFILNMGDQLDPRRFVETMTYKGPYANDLLDPHERVAMSMEMALWVLVEAAGGSIMLEGPLKEALARFRPGVDRVDFVTNPDESMGLKNTVAPEDGEEEPAAPRILLLG